MSRRILFGIAIALAAIGTVAVLLWQRRAPHTVSHTAIQDTGTKYTCSMHPQIIRNEPGLCPICRMDLVPLGRTPASATEVSFMPSQMRLANIVVRPVSAGASGNNILLNGRLVA